MRTTLTPAERDQLQTWVTAWIEVAELEQPEGPQHSNAALVRLAGSLKSIARLAMDVGVEARDRRFMRYAYGHVVGNGQRVFEEAAKLGAEGIVSKRRRSLHDQIGRAFGARWPDAYGPSTT